MEIDSARSAKAKALLLYLRDVKINVYNQDLLQDIPESRFDIVLAMHSLYYYIKSCMEGIKRAIELTKEKGYKSILILT